MAKSPTDTKTDTVQREAKTTAAAPIDAMPEADDDAADDPAPSPAPVAESAPPDPEEREEAAPRRLSPRDEAVAAAAQRYRELRDEANKKDGDAEGSEGAQAEAAEPPATEDATGAAPAPAAKAGAPQGQEPAAQPETRTLIIDGKPVEMSLDEIIRTAQKNLAADNRLEEAKLLLQEAKALRGTQPANQPTAAQTAQTQPDPSQASEAANQPPKLDRAKLRNTTERIQVGDADDGADAFAEAFEENNKLVLAQAKAELLQELKQAIRPEVNQTIVQEKAQTEIDGAIQQFGRDNQDIIAQPLLTQAAMTAVQEEMIRAMVKSGVPEDQVRTYCDTPQKTGLAYGHLRQAGRPLPPLNQVLDAGAKTIRATFGLKAPGSEPPPSQSQPARPAAPPGPTAAEQRLERKRAAPSQPRSAGVRGTVPPPQRPKTPAEVIEGMAKDRGFRRHH